MKYIIKLHPEIMMKSDTVRRRFVKILAGNLRHILKPIDDTTAVVQHWDYIEVRHKNDEHYFAIIDKLQCTSGIHHILEVEESPFTDLHDIFLQTLPKVKDSLENKSFVCGLNGVAYTPLLRWRWLSMSVAVSTKR